MRILIVNTSENTGGAAVAAKRLLNALHAEGSEVSLLVRDKKSDDPRVISVTDSPFVRIPFIWERLTIFLHNRLRKTNLYEVSLANTGLDITKHPAFQSADVIHLHWINQGMLSLKTIRKILRTGKPVVWTMHDMWPLTGICHYSGTCRSFSEQCGLCPLLQKPHFTDLSRLVFERKKSIWKNIHFVTCSEWLKNQCTTSRLLENSDMVSIPNAIDTTFYKPGNRAEARKALHLPEGKKLILFGAYSLTDKRKGMRFLMEASRKLSDWEENVELVFCGSEKQPISESFGLKIRSLGYIDSPEKMVQVYQAVDCYVIPSLEENLPNMIMEAMACGIPCVGFRTGGIPEMIDDSRNGFLAELASSESLADGIRAILESNNPESMSVYARQFVLDHYSEAAIARKHLELYTRILP